MIIYLEKKLNNCIVPILRRKVFQKGDYPKAAFLIVQILISYKEHEETGDNVPIKGTK